MAILSFLLVNRQTGVTVHTRRYDGEGDTNDILFSGAIVAIGDLMEEVKVGKIREVTTDAYQVLNSMSNRLVAFCVGNFDNSAPIFSFLDRYVSFVDSWVDDVTKPISDSTESLINAMLDEFYEIERGKNIVTATFKYMPHFGYQPVFESGLSAESEKQMVGYLTEHRSEKTGEIFELLPSGESLIAFSPEESCAVIVYLGKDVTKLMSVIPVKHLFKTYYLEYFPPLPELERMNHAEVGDMIEFYSRRIQELFRIGMPHLDFLENSEVISLHRDGIAMLYDELLTGNMIAIVGGDEALSISTFLSFVSGIYFIDREFDQYVKFPILCLQGTPPEALTTAGYTVYVTEERKVLNNSEDGSLFRKVCGNLNIDENVTIEAAYQIQVETRSIFDICKTIMIQRIFGADASELLKMQDPFLRTYLTKILSWINKDIIGWG